MKLFDDYDEIVPGALDKVRLRLNGGKNIGNSRSTTSYSSSLLNIFRQGMALISNSPKPGPQQSLSENLPTTTTTIQTPQPHGERNRIIYLLFCLPQSVWGHTLFHQQLLPDAPRTDGSFSN
jgi:hypothetical protein